MPECKPFYITTPLYYVNDELHIGHATTTLYADTLARLMKLDGRDVRFLTGSDEHGQKIFKAAEAKGTTPKELADGIVGKFKELWGTLGISEHDFIRTTDPYHEATVKAFFRKIMSQKTLSGEELIYKGSYTALYCTDCEQAYTESNLVDGKCPIHKTEPTKLDEDNYFFRLSAFEDALRLRLADETLTDKESENARNFLTHLRNSDRTEEEALRRLEVQELQDANSLLPSNRRAEILGKVKVGLEDTSITRTAFDWGVGLPGDEDHVLWVWFDALINYVAGLCKDTTERLLAEGKEELDLDELIQDPNFVKYWPEVHHVLGKDILWHHSVIWWSMLAAAGLPMPNRVFAHGWWTVEGDKMSKTLGNVIKPAQVAEEYSRDILRYFVLTQGPAKGDSDWQQGRLKQAINGELAGEFGNLLSRVLGMLGKYFDGKVPECSQERIAKWRSECEDVWLQVNQTPGYEMTDVRNEIFHCGTLLMNSEYLKDLAVETAELVSLGGYVQDVWRLVSGANKAVDGTAPFKLAKDPERQEDLAAVMHALLQTLRTLAYFIEPFLPDSSIEMKKQLGLLKEDGSLGDSEKAREGMEERGESVLAWAAQWNPAYVGTQTTKGDALFPRLEE